MFCVSVGVWPQSVACESAALALGIMLHASKSWPRRLRAFSGRRLRSARPQSAGSVWFNGEPPLPQHSELYDVGIIGGGVVGCALANHLSTFHLRVALIESRWGPCHQPDSRGTLCWGEGLAWS